MFSNWTRKKTEVVVEDIGLSLRDQKLLELVAQAINVNKSAANCYASIDKRLKKIENRLDLIDKATLEIPNRQDRLIKLFMELADRVAALTPTK